MHIEGLGGIGYRYGGMELRRRGCKSAGVRSARHCMLFMHERTPVGAFGLATVIPVLGSADGRLWHFAPLAILRHGEIVGELLSSHRQDLSHGSTSRSIIFKSTPSSQRVFQLSSKDLATSSHRIEDLTLSFDSNNSSYV